MNKNLYAIIPARGGSKGVPRKNIKLLNGIPLIAYSIIAAKGCSVIDKVIVSTEDCEIKEIAENYGAVVFDRPIDLAQDYSKTADVIINVINTLDDNHDLPKNFVLLQATSPLRNSTHLDDSCKTYFNNNLLSLVSFSEVEHHPYNMIKIKNNQIEPLFDFDKFGTPRQKMEKMYRTNGAIYMMNTLLFLEKQKFVIEETYPFIMDSIFSLDIDSNIDFITADNILKNSYLFV